jgi:peptide methionine sulfoxide reductase MsrA
LRITAPFRAAFIADVEASGLWPGKVVTKLSPAGDFWEAEPEHQDYLERYPNGYTCHFVRPQWKVAAAIPVKLQQFLSSFGVPGRR